MALVATTYGEMRRLSNLGQKLLADPDADLRIVYDMADPDQAQDAWRFVMNDLETAHRLIVFLAQEIERLQN